MIGKYLSRIVGLMWILTSLLWGVLGVMGILYTSNWVESAQSKLEVDFLAIDNSLDSVRVVVIETSDVISSTNQSLGTLQRSVYDASTSLSDIRPLIGKTTKVVTIDVPEALDGVQESMPSLIETAKSVDETLTWMSNFEITIPNPFGTDWNYDFGISYNPAVPLDQALESMSLNLVGIPDDLRDLDQNLSETDNNLIVVSDDLALLADDIKNTNEKLIEVLPRIEDFIGYVDNVQSSLQDTQESVFNFFDFGQKVLKAILFLLVVSQIPSIFMGVQLVRGELTHKQPDNENK
jgi:hypothetical protein